MQMWVYWLSVGLNKFRNLSHIQGCYTSKELMIRTLGLLEHNNTQILREDYSYFAS